MLLTSSCEKGYLKYEALKNILGLRVFFRWVFLASFVCFFLFCCGFGLGSFKQSEYFRTKAL